MNKLKGVLAVIALVVFGFQTAEAQNVPPVWTSSSSYAAGDIVLYGGNWYRALVAVNPEGPLPTTAFGTWELNYVRFGTTLTVGDGQSFSALSHAWQFAQSARIADGAYLHISIVTTGGNHIESYTSAWSLDHGSGALISIIGDNPSNINLQFPNGSGITIDSGHSLASISGVTISGAGANTSNNSDGIYATRNATISSISDCYITNFEYGVVADYGASVGLVTPNTVKECIDGIVANHSATVSAIASTIALSTPSNLGFDARGMWAENGGVIEADGCTLTNSNTGFGIGAYCLGKGVIDLSYATDSGWEFGVYGTLAGYVSLQSASMSKNATDVAAYQGGIVEAIGSTATTTVSDSGKGSYIYI